VTKRQKHQRAAGSDVRWLLEHYIKGVQFPEVSGFEVLELLDVRSKLATRENELDVSQRIRLEEADSLFLRYAPMFYERVATLGELREFRRRAVVSCSHWWWYLEKLVQREVATSV
jgi:hypothetical protein